MATTDETVRVNYAGNNSTVTPYTVPFRFLANADVDIYVRTSAGVETTLVEATDYTLIGAGTNPPTGSFTTAVAVPASSTVIVVRRSPSTQTATYTETDEFPAASHEAALDKATLLLQEAKDLLGHCFRLRDAENTIAALDQKVDSLLGLDPAGVPLLKTASEVLTWINLAQTLGNFPTKTWANAAERATAVPDFIGQLGMQRDTFVTYMGTALSAGSWTATVGTVADGAVTTAKLADGALSADAAGRLKMAAAFLMATHLNVDAVTGQTAKTLLEDADRLLGWSSADAALRSFAGNVAVPPGSIIQTVFATPYTANANITAIIPGDDSVPQITEGGQILTLAISPRFVDSTILLRFQGNVARTVASGGIGAAMFRNTVSDTIGSSFIVSASAGNPLPIEIEDMDSPATTSATTYTVRAGPTSAGTIRFNGQTGTRIFGGTQAATLIAQEIKV